MLLEINYSLVSEHDIPFAYCSAQPSRGWPRFRIRRQVLTTGNCSKSTNSALDQQRESNLRHAQAEKRGAHSSLNNSNRRVANLTNFMSTDNVIMNIKAQFSGLKRVANSS